MKRTFLLVTCCMVMFTYSYAATITWTGATDSDWDTATNWDVGVPTAADDVIIDSGTAVLSSTTTILRVTLLGSADLTIDAGAILNVDGFTGNDDGIEVNNSAILTNNGIINVSNINGGTGADGIYIRGLLTNNGAVTITNTAQHGLYMQRGTFTNNAGATLTISNSGLSNGDGDNIYVDDSSGTFGLFTNNGTVTLTTIAGADDGIYINDGSTFDNNNLVTISGGGKNGIRIDDNGVFNNKLGAVFEVDGGTDDHIFLDNTGLFVNDGTLNLTNGDAGDASLYVTDNGIFTNNLSGIINISGSGNYSMQLDANNETVSPATIINFGTIEAIGGSADGLRIQENGVFNNEPSGSILFNGCGEESIKLSSSDPGDNNIFNNSGIIEIIDAADHGMEIIDGTFNNLSGGLIVADNCTDDGIRMQNLGLFINDGAIQIDNSGSEDIETETIASFVNTANATFSPGSSPGDLEIRDDFDLGASTTTFEIDGLANTTDYDQIINSTTANTLTISADSKIELVWGFVPVEGDCFNIIDGSGAISGTFDLANVTSSDPSINYEINYLPVGAPTEVQVKIVAALPIELVYFSGKETQEGSKLSWQTASEINNEGFDVERSNDGTRWSQIGYVKGSGDSRELIQYSYIDKEPANGINYYRLKQNDFDGNFEYSNMITVHFEKAITDYKFYPNPIEDILYIDAIGGGDNGEVQLRDYNGKLLWSKKGKVTQIPFGGYSPGIYYVSIKSSTETIIKKVIKK